MRNACWSASTCGRRRRTRTEPRMKSSPAKKTARRRSRRRRRYVLRLYVTGTTGRSVRAIENVRRICDEHLAGHYELEVVDIYKNLPLARGDQIIAAPTLIKRLPAPLRRLIGDMSDEQRVLVGLDLRPRRAHRVEVPWRISGKPGALRSPAHPALAAAPAGGRGHARRDSRRTRRGAGRARRATASRSTRCAAPTSRTA